MDTNADNTMVPPRELVVEQDEYKGYSTEYECGWKWEIEKDNELLHHGAAISPNAAVHSIESMIKVFTLKDPT